MSPFHLKLLLMIFFIHLAVFARIALRTRRGYYICLVMVFVSLVAMTALRLWAPGLGVGATALWMLFRWSAWGLTFMAAALWLRYRLRMRN